MFDQKEEILYLGEFSYLMFKFCGFWMPVNWKSQWKIVLYKIYSIIALMIFLLFNITFLVPLFENHESTLSYILSLFYFCSMFNVLMNMIVLFWTRNIFIQTNEMFLSEICQPRDNEEIAILRECSHEGRRNTILYFIMVHINGFVVYFAPLISKTTTLPLPAWFPYSLDSNSLFISSYLYQIIGVIMAVSISVGIECLALTTMLQIYGQLKINMHRLNLLSKLSKENNEKSPIYNQAEYTKNCIQHHLLIYSLGKNLNKQFGFVVFTQFFASSINICAIIFNLSKVNLSSRIGSIMISAAATYFFQIFIYCFYGDLVRRKSLEIESTIYFLSWDTFKIETKKSLLIIMMRATRPIELTGASIITMSFETFMNVVKSSYSSYNLLKSSYN